MSVVSWSAWCRSASKLVEARPEPEAGGFVALQRHCCALRNGRCIYARLVVEDWRPPGWQWQRGPRSRTAAFGPSVGCHARQQYGGGRKRAATRGWLYSSCFRAAPHASACAGLHLCQHQPSQPSHLPLAWAALEAQSITAATTGLDCFGSSINYSGLHWLGLLWKLPRKA